MTSLKRLGRRLISGFPRTFSPRTQTYLRSSLLSTRLFKSLFLQAIVLFLRQEQPFFGLDELSGHDGNSDEDVA